MYQKSIFEIALKIQIGDRKMQPYATTRVSYLEKKQGFGT